MRHNKHLYNTQSNSEIGEMQFNGLSPNPVYCLIAVHVISEGPLVCSVQVCPFFAFRNPISICCALLSTSVCPLVCATYSHDTLTTRITIVSIFNEPHWNCNMYLRSLWSNWSSLWFSKINPQYLHTGQPLYVTIWQKILQCLYSVSVITYSVYFNYGLDPS